MSKKPRIYTSFDIVQKFLSEFSTKTGEKPTHTTMDGGSFSIPDSKIIDLYDLLANCIIEKYNVGLIERPLLINNTNVLLIDFDFRQESDERLFKYEDLIEIFNKYIDIIKKYVIEPKSGYIFTRKLPYENNGYYKDGLHIMFPDLRLNINIIEKIRNDALIEFSYLKDKFKFTNTIEDIIDKSVILNNGWFMFGNTKPLIAENQYILRYFINSNGEDQTTKIKPNINDIKSVSSFIQEIAIRNKDINEARYTDEGLKILATNIKIDNKISEINIIDKKGLCQLLNLLSSKYYDEYNDWIRVGWLLFNLGGFNNSIESNQYFDIWDQFSMKSLKYKPNCCDKYWKKMKKINNCLGLGSLIKWCNEINQLETAKIIQEYNLLNKFTIEFGDSYDFNYTKEIINKSQNIDEDLFNYFNHYHAKIINKSKFIKMKFRNDIFDELEETDITEQNLIISYKDLIYFKEIEDGKKIKIHFIHEWINNINKQTYNDVIHHPKLNNIMNLNLFTGFNIKYIDDFNVNESKIQRILNHILTVFCGSDKEIYNYFICWLSHIFQKPETKTGIAMMMRSDEGAGKGTFRDFIMSLLGERNVANIDDYKKIMQFNGILSNKLFTFFDELPKNNNDMDLFLNTMKSYITENKIMIRKMYKDPFNIDDFNNFWFVSNNYNIARISTTDRRFLCLECDPKFIGNKQYFDELLNDYKNFDIQLHFFHYLMNKDISNWNNRKIPETKYKKYLQMLNIPPILLWMNEYIEDKNEHNIFAKELYDTHKSYRSEYDYETKGYSFQTFKSEMMQFFKFEAKSKRKDALSYNFTDEMISIIKNTLIKKNILTNEDSE